MNKILPKIKDWNSKVNFLILQCSGTMIRQLFPTLSLSSNVVKLNLSMNKTLPKNNNLKTFITLANILVRSDM